MNTVIQNTEIVNKNQVKDTGSGEKIKRTLAKTISWRALGTLSTVVISYIITGTLALAFSIGFIELVSKLVLYYVHERTWNKITWGK
ncbi:DUF2061 domain-containing protein [Psychroserpens algicola]|uniref:DUF2061 domain-containing protein n=1 Tax=Psychroserpens algicola TaxID=1719034 RepID=A0ABT0H925_9FLAO|nr:DUF2061 domain-containing protein [Psychroserpens algicola]MCK8480868.1 DUF2061 domain-containing protein [Psychroserpens algicola]